MNSIFFEHPLSKLCKAITTTTSVGNMAYQVSQDQETVSINRSYFYSTLQINKSSFTFVHQSHSDVIVKITESNFGAGQDNFESGIEADALYTKIKNVPLGIFHADCAPIFFIDEVNQIVGIIHAGFQGTMKHVTYKCLSKVISDEKLDPINIKIYIGPLRQKNSFEIDDDSMNKIKEADFASCLDENHFDLRQANVLDVLKSGIPEENISYSEIDTVNDSRCFSAYKKTPVGRMTSIIYLK